MPTPSETQKLLADLVEAMDELHTTELTPNEIKILNVLNCLVDLLCINLKTIGVPSRKLTPALEDLQECVSTNPLLQNWVPRTGFVSLRGGYIPISNIKQQSG